MGVFITGVYPRWSDVDAFGHVNNASVVTLLEEARVKLLFDEAKRHGVLDMAAGIVVAKLNVHYRAPLRYTSDEIIVKISVRELKASSFMLDYAVHPDRSDTSPVVLSAHTLMAPYDVRVQRPRRLSEAERDFLAAYHNGHVSEVLSHG